MGTSGTPLTGLPDFGALLPAQAATMFAPFGNGSYAALPEQLVVATDANGQPKFLLEIEQQIGNFAASAQYATLDMRLVGDYPLAAALEAARELAPGATVAQLTIDDGFARLYATSSVITPPQELLAPIPLGLGGDEGARWTMRISAEAGEILKAAIVGNSDGTAADGVAPLGARMEYVASGVAPRVSVAVEFEPATLIGALIAQLGGSSTRMVAQSVLTTLFLAQGATLPIKMIGTTGSANSVYAQAMEDRLLAAYATFVPAPGPTDPIYFQFADPATLDTATVHWDLSLPAIVSRAWVVLFDPLSSMRTVIQNGGSDTLVKYLSIPPAPLGLSTIQVTTNLPPNRRGVAMLGANLEAPADPPYRPASINQQVLFTEPDDTATVEWRLSIREQLQFSVTGFAVFAEAGSTRQDTAAPRAADTTWVQLQQNDFPVRFIYLSADPRVLAQADIGISLTYTMDDKAHAEPYALNAAEPAMSIGLPQSAVSVALTLIATPHDGSAALAIPSPSGNRVHVDLTSFAEYGPHVVALSAALASADPPLFLDLVPQAQQDNPAAQSKVMLTPDMPSTRWSYLALSPFSAGFCYRVSAATGAAPAAWSIPLPPSSTLVLASDGSLATDAAAHWAAI